MRKVSRSLNPQEILQIAPQPRTRDRILEAALRLFNEKGERNVSTNHICAELGISPGNLYYHFRNKSEIVFALFEQYRSRFERVLGVPADRSLTYEDKVGYFEAIFEAMWEYRFLHRDMEHLLAESEQLCGAYRTFARASVGDGRRILQGLVDAGMMQASPEVLDGLIVNIWVIITAWSGFLQAVALPDQRNSVLNRSRLKRGIYQIICLEEAYLSPEVKARLPELKALYLDGAGTDPLGLFL